VRLVGTPAAEATGKPSHSDLMAAILIVGVLGFALDTVARAALSRPPP